MLQPEQLKKREHKLEYLKGLLKGKHTIYEILEQKVTFFVCTNEPGVCYEAEGINRLQPKIINGAPVLFTTEKIEWLKKQPNNTCIILNFGKDNVAFYEKNLSKALKEFNDRQISLE
jgi:hypothetical protein